MMPYHMVNKKTGGARIFLCFAAATNCRQRQKQWPVIVAEQQLSTLTTGHCFAFCIKNQILNCPTISRSSTASLASSLLDAEHC